jgi:hypothetical protein
MNIGTLLTRHARYRPHHVAVSPRHLDRTADRLHPEDLPTQQGQRLTLMQGSLLFATHDWWAMMRPYS